MSKIELTCIWGETRDSTNAKHIRLSWNNGFAFFVLQLIMFQIHTYTRMLYIDDLEDFMYKMSITSKKLHTCMQVDETNS